MNKAVLTLAASAALATATLAPVSAEARCYGCGVGLGVAGGLIAGAAIGSALAAPPPAYAYPRTYYPVAGYEPYPAYAGGPAYSCAGGYWARRPVRDAYGHIVGYSRPRFFCPAG